MRKTIAIALAALAFAACRPRAGGGPAINRDAIKALGGAVREPNFGRAYWRRQHDANTPEWREAKRLCGETVLADYPNCLPVNDLVQADQKKKAEEGNKAAAKNDEMFRRGYQYDFARKEWLPYREMQAAGCTYTYPTPGHMTWRCPPDFTIPQGIPDSNFAKEGE